MAKRSVPQSAPTVGGDTKPRPTVRFELPDGLPKNLPGVEQPIRLLVTGTLVKAAAKGADYNDYDCLTVRPSSVTVAKGKK